MLSPDKRCSFMLRVSPSPLSLTFLGIVSQKVKRRMTRTKLSFREKAHLAYEVLVQLQNILLRHERHLHIDLSEFRLAI